MSAADGTLYLCPDCGWKGTDPKELEHPSGDFPIKFQCPNCSGTEVEANGK
jgi:predicted RNA-binding Zn-ribbon protein involved in translation (DUF1610 family)